jgi:hypothetical protein
MNIPTQNNPVSVTHYLTKEDLRKGPKHNKGQKRKQMTLCISILLCRLLLASLLDTGLALLVFAWSLLSVNSDGSMLQNEAPRFLMMEGDMAGGVELQAKQFLSLQAGVLKPLYSLLSLRLRLTSASDRIGAFPFPFLARGVLGA